MKTIESHQSEFLNLADAAVMLANCTGDKRRWEN